MSILQLSGLKKTYGSGDLAVQALDGIDLSVQAGEVSALLGPSGSGKSTLLNCISLILEPSAGSIELSGKTVYAEGRTYVHVRRFRRENIGFIFQGSFLIPFLNALENVYLAMELNGRSGKSARKRAFELLQDLGMEHRSNAYPGSLSGGEMQRLAIARALANDPKLILADEPTARFSRRAVEQQKQDIEALIKNEKGIKADLLRVKVRLADLEQQIITANNRLDALNRLLANQMGIKTREDRLPVQGELSFDSADPDDDVSLQDAYSQRNDYQALKTRVVAARKSLAASRAEYWPNVELQSSYGGRWAVGDSTQQPGASDSADVGSIGVYLKLPLFTGGEISAGVAKKQAELSSLEERLRDLKLRIRREVQDSADSVRSAREKVQMTRTAIDAAKEALNIKKAKYNLGKTTISEFLDSQADLLGAQTDLARALGEYNTARARLELAKGTILQGIKK